MSDFGERAPVDGAVPDTAPTRSAPERSDARKVSRGRAPARLMASLEVGPADDPFEREADALADRVVRALQAGATPTPGPSEIEGRIGRSATGARRDARPEPAVADGDSRIRRTSADSSRVPPTTAPDGSGRIQRGSTVSGRFPPTTGSDGAGRIQRSALGPDGGPLPAAAADEISAAARRGGDPLPSRIQRQMGGAFGTDFGAVRTHTGRRADALNETIGARAFTVGNDIFFRGGLPDTGSTTGQHLVAHELAHTLQQRGSTAAARQIDATKRTTAPRVQRNGNPPNHAVTVRAIGFAAVRLAMGEAKATLANNTSKALGAGKGGWKQSGQVKAFKKALTELARQVARQDIRAMLKDPDVFGDTQLGPATKKFLKVTAYAQAYKDAENHVDAVLKRKAEQFVESNFDPGDALLNSVGPKAQKAAWLKFNPDKTDAAWDAAEKIAVPAVKARAELVKAQATQWTANVTGKQEAPLGATSPEDMADLIAETTSEEEVGPKALEEVIRAESMEEGIGKFGTLMDKVLKRPGQSVAFAVDFSIPLDAAGVASLTFGLEGKAGRGTTGFTTSGVTQLGDKKRLELMGKFTATFGVAALGLKVGAKVGFFVRSGADTTKDAMAALKYGSFRAAAAVNNKLGNWWVGKKTGSESISPLEVAEMWAAYIEETVFDKDDSAFADIGMSADGSAEVNLIVAEIKASVGDEFFTRYDQEALKDRLGDLFASPKARKRAAERRKLAGGDAMLSFNASFGAKVGICGQSVEFGLAASAEMRNEVKELWDNIGFEVNATLGFGPGDTEAVGRIAAGLVAGILGAVENLHALIKRKDKFATVDLLGDVNRIVNAGLENEITDAVAGWYEVPGGQGDVEIDDVKDIGKVAKPESIDAQSGIDMSGGLQFAFTFGRADGKAVWRFELREVKTLEVKFGVGSVKFEKTKRLAAFGRDADKKRVKELIGKRAKARLSE